MNISYFKENKLIVLILSTIFLAIVARYSLAIYLYNIPACIQENGNLISILTPDAGLYGYYAQLLIDNKPHLSDVHLIEYLIYFLYKITPFNLDQIMLYTPAYLASFVLIPVVLIVFEYTKSFYISFFAGIVSIAGFGYYSRTYLGYFDTDVLNVFLPMMIVYFMMRLLRTKDNINILYVAIFNILFIAWYHSSYPIILGLNGFFILVSIIFDYKNSKMYSNAIILAISILKISIFLKAPLLIIVYFLGNKYKINYKYYLGLLAIAIFVAIMSGKLDISVIEHHLNRYFFKASVIENANNIFVSPMQYVAEATTIPLNSIISHLAGNKFILGLSLIGYFIFVIRHKEFIVSLPLLALAFMSLKAGVRFHIFGVFVLIIGYAYLTYTIIYLLSKIEKLNKQIVLVPIIAILYAQPIYETYYSIRFWNTNVANPVFNKEQVKALDELKKISKDSDYVVTWWDYGWPIWYYTGMQTLIDNGRHHEDNYTVARIMLTPSQYEANKAINYFYEKFNNTKNIAILQALAENNNDLDTVYAKINAKDFKVDKKVDKYIVIPLQLKELLYTMYTFANIDTKTGKPKGNNIFMEAVKLGEDENYIYLSQNLRIDKKRALVIQSKDEIIPIKQFDHILYKNNQKLLKELPTYPNGIRVINFLDKYYFMDDYFYNSTFVQLLFYNNYDHNLFEDVYTGETISIYKVK